MALKEGEHDGPRELEIFSDEQVEEVMESLEHFKGKIEQLQAYCEQVNQSRMKAKEELIEEKKKHNQELAKREEEMNLLRNANIELMSNKMASPEKRGNFSVAVLKCAIDAENAEARIQDLTSKVRCLELTLADKDKHVSLMEWQIMNLEATVATLQAERDQLILELDLNNPNESHIQNEDIDHTHFQDDFQNKQISSQALYCNRNHNGTVNERNENLSLRQMLSMSAEWIVNKGPLSHAHRPPLRTFSGSIKRDGRGKDFSHSNATHSLEDFEDFNEVDNGLGLGKLTRTTNFCDILDADEYSNFHVSDTRLSNADSVLEVLGEENGSALQPLSKKWATFESGLANSLEEDTFDKSIVSEISLASPRGIDSSLLQPRDRESLDSSTSDFSSAFHSSQDFMVSSTEEAWGEVRGNLPPHEVKKVMSKTEMSKSDSCILTTTAKSPVSVKKEDIWNFTPDSVVNVSTGENLMEKSSLQSVGRSPLFTTSIEILMNNSTVDGTPNEDVLHVEDGCGQAACTVNENVKKEGIIEDNEESRKIENVILRHELNEGTTSHVKPLGKSNSACDRSSPKEELLEGKHEKSLSDPVKKPDQKRGVRKLKEYQKWQKHGRRGKPPGDLKISDC